MERTKEQQEEILTELQKTIDYNKKMFGFKLKELQSNANLKKIKAMKEVDFNKQYPNNWNENLKNNKAMKTKEINEYVITAPEGQVIVETIKDGKKFISFEEVQKKVLTYDDVCRELFHNETLKCSEKIKFIDAFLTGEMRYEDNPELYKFTGNEFTSEEEIESLLCLNKLRNVAKYLNPDIMDSEDIETSEWNYYLINRENGRLERGVSQYKKGSNIYFYNEEAYERALEILGEDTIRKALNLQV